MLQNSKSCFKNQFPKSNYDIKLKICILMFFRNRESIGSILETVRQTELPDFALQGCQIYKSPHNLHNKHDRKLKMGIQLFFGTRN